MSPERFRTVLAAEVARLQIELSPEKLDALCAYYDLLRAWNRRIRLVGTVEPARAAAELFADSLVAGRFASSLAADRTAPTDRGPVALIDIGSGAGLPGIPIRIMRPEWQATLIDSDAKKISFLKQLARTLDLHDIRILRGRAEHCAHDPAYRERFALAFCRAVAAPAIACELALPFLAREGSLVLHTSARAGEPDADRGLAAARAAADRLGATIEISMTYDLSTVAGERMLWQVRKRGATPPEFPRDANTMKKHPLA